MTIRDILPILPRYSDNSGYDVRVVLNDHKHSLFLCKRENLSESNMDKEVEVILPGMTRAGGHYDEELQVVVTY